MITSALVLTSRDLSEELECSLRNDPRFQIGKRSSCFVPLVTTTGDLRDAREIYEELESNPMVADVQLVSWYDDEESGADAVLEGGVE